MTSEVVVGAIMSLHGSSVSHLNCSIKGSRQESFGNVSLQAQRDANKVKEIENLIMLYWELSIFHIQNN